MGKAAKRAKAKRQKYFKYLSETNPDQFDYEWKKRIPSWERELIRSPNKYRNCRNNSLLDEALNILKECGEEFYKKYCTMTIATLDVERFNPSFYQTDYQSISNYKKIEEICQLYGPKEIKRRTYFIRP